MFLNIGKHLSFSLNIALILINDPQTHWTFAVALRAGIAENAEAEMVDFLSFLAKEYIS